MNPSREASPLAMVLFPAPAGPSIATTTRFCFVSAKRQNNRLAFLAPDRAPLAEAMTIASRVTHSRIAKRTRILAWLLPGLLSGGSAHLTGWSAARALRVRVGDLLLLLRVEDELPLRIQRVVVVHLDALAFGLSCHPGDAAADGLRPRNARRHSARPRRGENVADHVRRRIILSGGGPRLPKAWRCALRAGSRGICRRASEILRVHWRSGLARKRLTGVTGGSLRARLRPRGRASADVRSTAAYIRTAAAHERTTAARRVRGICVDRPVAGEPRLHSRLGQPRH